jgi:hypothetical protein
MTCQCGHEMKQHFRGTPASCHHCEKCGRFAIRWTGCIEWTVPELTFVAEKAMTVLLTELERDEP